MTVLEVRVLGQGFVGEQIPSPRSPIRTFLVTPPTLILCVPPQTSRSSLGFTQPSAFQPLPTCLPFLLKTTHFPPYWLVLISQDLLCFA